ncbi:hypothetical protein Q6D67_10990 [Haliea sp. E1-2-M8]|uniref:hypothetical protein n=1 Tax=Haliea sp. E1-2-M8 TaxID=3064706 RepID=UPI00271CFEF6|nr:hypothetical protein [Haliea sp. E1-2-M8]MDO8862229.1 hypothetical protein [Haliea sp. E1-2-M8]
MEKVIFCLWRQDAVAADDFGAGLRQQLVPQLEALPALRGLRLAVADGAVAAAADKRMQTTGPLPDALLSLWLDDAWRRPDPAALAPELVARSCAWLVAEAEPLVNTTQLPGADARVPGFCQVALLQRPPRLDEQTWLGIWKGSHGRVAIDTQSTFAYRQNLVVCALDADAPLLHAVVEENFPDAAMTSRHEFYAAADDATLTANEAAMMESCARFIDFDKIDVVPMSEYLFSAAAAP